MEGTDTNPVLHTSSPERTRTALADAAVLRWWQTTAFVQVAGPDAPTLLDGLCTQAVERIEPGHGVLGLFLDAKAKLIAPALIHRTTPATWYDPRADEPVHDAPRLLLETLPDLIEPLRAHLSRYRLRARASIEPCDLATVGIHGATAARQALPNTGELLVSLVAGTEDTHDVLQLIAESDQIAQLVQELSAAPSGLELADPDALESARIERGVAGLHDLLPGRMPAEIGGMQAAVSLDAGCYLGQEPVARLHYRGHANRTLRRLQAAGAISPGSATGVADDVDPDAPFELRRTDDAPDARAVGRLTTWARNPTGGTVALAILRREIAAGTLLQLPDGDELRVLDEPPGS